MLLAKASRRDLLLPGGDLIRGQGTKDIPTHMEHLEPMELEVRLHRLHMVLALPNLWFHLVLHLCNLEHKESLEHQLSAQHLVSFQLLHLVMFHLQVVSFFLLVEWRRRHLELPQQ